MAYNTFLYQRVCQFEMHSEVRGLVKFALYWNCNEMNHCLAIKNQNNPGYTVIVEMPFETLTEDLYKATERKLEKMIKMKMII